ncbi:2OG-Fe(II) oxygenase [Mesorhizobium sp. BAC0120]|uniref:2OG-Fe(II) oxygenase n=1 Tax=Mesorhizobium sp. BAC0120 TaxID=3090670 RepID=UPI00298C0CFD|nr:2OG-Fe(II) oxygenase [Mesorhizobium sp. BAC0120]MDW6021644.1 2OG-Fe(II) oxygenase [Mesorhizobium sp. BAC0120]
MLRLDTLRATPIERDPFEYVIVKDFIEREKLKEALADYPEVPGPGSHPPSGLKISGGFKALIDEMLDTPFRKAVEEKFDIDLTGRPTMYTVRGFCRARDGKIHTDSKTKIITVLLYMNGDSWGNSTGRLRLLRNGSDLENYAVEIEPAGGTVLIFRRSENSWHGHHPYEGRRRAIQLNWVTDQSVVDREQGRHGFSSMIKRLFQPVLSQRRE